ncbi:MAG: hypothetical protein ACPGTG_05495, partial [Flavobacteriales bacterium]
MSEETNNALENFDWEKFESGQVYDNAATEEMTSMYEATLNSLNEDAVLTGKVTSLADREA